MKLFEEKFKNEKHRLIEKLKTDQAIIEKEIEKTEAQKKR